jgi:hypothetical protein
VGITVTAKGPTLDTLTRDVIKDLRAANKKAAKAAVKGGTQAIRKGAPRMFGRQLGARERITTWPDKWNVEIFPAKGQSGAWAIQESGAKPHPIKPRRGRALRLGADMFYADVNHPGVGGHGAWAKAGTRLAAAIDREITAVYDEVFE